MKNVIKILVVASVCVGLLIFWRYLPSENSNLPVNTPTNSITEENKIELSQTIVESPPQKKAAKSTLETPKKVHQTNTETQLQWDKKSLDEQWCLAKKQLTDSDYQIAQTQQQDWDILQGKARTRGLNNSEFYEQWTPNNQYIEAYESLQIEQLHSLAYEGDKWAMVAFVQHVKAPPKMQSEIAKRLMVQGASYYGLEYLVIDALSTAKTKLDKADTASAINHIIEAAVYAYWGLEYYNDGGLHPFIAITKREPFLNQFPIGPILKKSENEINQRLAELKAQITQQRSALYIEVPEPPATVRKMFASHVAMRDRLYKPHMDLLRSLNISDNEQIQITPCIVKINAYFAERMK